MAFQQIINHLPFSVRKKLTEKAVRKCIDILEQNHCRPFLAYGTALAALRDNTLRFKHDPDCDLGVMIHDWKPEVKKQLQKAGYKLEHELGTHKMGYELSFRKWGVKIDIFIFYIQGDKVWNCLWDLPDANGVRQPIFHTYPAVLFNARKSLMVGRNSYPVLPDINNYVQHIYGQQWATPVTQWDWRTDHHCIDKNFKPYEL